MKRYILAIGTILFAALAQRGISAPYTVTNPTDIWVGGNPVNGKSIVDPTGGVSINGSLSIGNYAYTTLNANENRFVFGMDTGSYTTGAGNYPKQFILTEAVSGADVDFSITGANQLTVDIGKATSPSNLIWLSNNNFTLTLETPVLAVGFVVSNLKTDNGFTVSFYTDSSKTNLLGSYHSIDSGVSSGVGPAGFAGYLSTTANIGYVELIRDSAVGSSLYIDDIALVVPEPSTVLLTTAGLCIALFFRRYRLRETV